MKIAVISALLVVVAAGGILASNNAMMNKSGSKQQNHPQVLLSTTRPDLGVNYSQVSKFKITSRKTTYHVGEMISLDMAMLNTANTPVHFRELSDPTLYVQTAKGTEIVVKPYGGALQAVTLDSFMLLERNEMITGSYDLLAGCQEREAVQKDDTLADDDKEAFEQGRFTTWGHACLSIERVGTYVITAEKRNNHVLTSQSRTNLKTAIGTIRSTPLTITIIE